MSSYVEPVEVAVFIFPFLAFFISIPFFIRQYRKYGRFILSKAIILYSFVFYLLCAYFLVILPLPTREAVAQLHTARYELQLGHSLMDFLQQTVFQLDDPSTYLSAIKQGVFLEPLFNILLLLPFGIYLNYYFEFSLKKTILLSFCLSLFFELTQLSGLYFIYPRPYRLFDVNDLVHNTLGGTLGYFLAPLITFMLPTREQLDESAYEKGRQVTLIRRLAAWLVDWLVLSAITFAGNLLAGIISKQWSFTDNSLLVYTLQVLGYFVLFNYLMKGQTLGKRLVKIRIVQETQQRVRLTALLKRYGLLYLLFYYLARINNLVIPYLNSARHILQLTALIIFLISFTLLLLLALNLVWAFIRRKRVLFYEKASHTFTVSTVEKSE